MKLIVSRTRVALSYASFLGGLVAFAGEGPDEHSIEEVVVIGSGLEETVPLDLRRFGNRVEIVTSEALELGGFNDLGQALQMRVPGLYLAAKNGAFDYMNCALQGSRCQDILWLIDGVRINNRLYNSTSPLDTVPAHMVERIEVLYGGQGIFYGTQSVAGVVNVVTKSFSEATEGRAGLAIDGNDGTHANVTYRTPFGDHRLVLYASQDEAEGHRPFRDEHYQPSGTDRARGYDVTAAGAKVGLALGTGSNVTLHAHRTDSRVDWASPANRAQSFNEREEDLLTAKWDYVLGDDVQLFVKGYLHRWDSHWTRRDNELDDGGNLTGNLVTRSDGDYWGYEDYGVTAMARMASDAGLEYVVGYDLQRFSGRDDVLLIADRTESVNAFFGQIRADETLFARTRIAVGARYNRPSGEGDIAVGNVSAQHALTDTLYLRGSAGTSFRLPDAWQLYGNDPCCTQGNPDLEGEKSRNFNLGVGGMANVAEGLSWEFILFGREVDDLIGTAAGMRVNTDRTVEFRGWEVSLAVDLAPSWQATFDYVGASAEEKGSSEQITDIPESNLKAGLAFQPDRGPVEFQVAWVGVGDVYDSVSGGIGRVEHGGYAIVDVAGAFYPDAERRHRIGLRLENAFDEDYATSLGRAFVDADGSSYRYDNLGTPRTFHLAYDFRF